MIAVRQHSRITTIKATPLGPEAKDATRSSASTVDAWARDLVQWFESQHPGIRVWVAFSGGVDSSVVAQAAFLGRKENARAVTAVSAAVSGFDRDRAQQVAQTIGISHQWLATGELQDAQYVQNDGRRCYHCKKTLYQAVHDLRLADEQERSSRPDHEPALIVSGANQDDLGDYRPGLQAAQEFGVRHPLVELGLGKSAVRALAAHWGLPNHDAPASPCLASRLAVGVTVTAERLDRVARAEDWLRRELGLIDLRVRVHPGELARIEVPVAQLGQLTDPNNHQRLVEAFLTFGFRFVSLDLRGLQSGGLNVLVPQAVPLSEAKPADASPESPKPRPAESASFNKAMI